MNLVKEDIIAKYFERNYETSALFYVMQFNDIPSIYNHEFHTTKERFKEVLPFLKKENFEELLIHYYTDIQREDLTKKVDIRQGRTYYVDKKKQIVIGIGKNDCSFAFHNDRLDEVKLICERLKEFMVINPEDPKIYLLTSSSDGLQLTECDIRKFDLDLDHYNDEFKEYSEKIENFIDDKDKSGLVLLHGKPGTGKTTYIRYLANKYKSQRMIYIPNDLISIITGPDFISSMIKYSNSVLILEDCETVLKERIESEGMHIGVSNILNMTDGLLGDCLKMKIIATFNSDVKKIDDALRRPGRLICEYEFEFLQQEKAKKLLTKLGKGETFNPTTQYTLANIYNDSNVAHLNKKDKVIGFGG